MRLLNLGCGSKPRLGWINLDVRELPGVDIVRDVLRGLPFDDNSIDEIYSENFLEHIPQPEVIWLMNEMHRVLAVPGGRARHLIPAWGTEIWVQDPTHLSRWSEETFTYFEYSHGRNKVYPIKPWVIRIGRTDPNRLLEVEMVKYV